MQKNADVIITLKKIRRYKASVAVMEKASEVYNKLKLKFIGKSELTIKSQEETPNEDLRTMDNQLRESTIINGELGSLREQVENHPKSQQNEKHNDSNLATLCNRSRDEDTADQHIPVGTAEECRHNIDTATETERQQPDLTT